MPEPFKRLNILSECRDARLEIWACPPFLFVVMGAVNITAILLSWLLANRYVAEPEVVSLIVLGISMAIFVIGNFIIHGFRQIAEANRIKTEFIAIVSHQLRSPLSVFKWTLDVMLRNKSGTQSKSAADGSYLTMLTENTEKMIQLVNMLLEVSRIDAGRLLLHHDEIELGVITQEIVRAVSPFAQASRVKIEYASSGRLPAVRGDREKIKMVIQNLVDNAIRYSPDGGRVRVDIASVSPESVEWKVQDQGVGIPQEAQRYVFQKFFRAGGPAQGETQGSGLGLYIARSIIAALGGEIGFRSKVGQGSTFWFRLPIYH